MSSASATRASVRRVTFTSPASIFCQCRHAIPARSPASSKVNPASSRVRRTLRASARRSRVSVAVRVTPRRYGPRNLDGHATCGVAVECMAPCLFPHRRFALVLAITASLFGGNACSKKAPPTDGAPGTGSTGVTKKKTPSLPPEPAPPVAERADEVPRFEAKLADDATYTAIWSGPRADLNVLLTHLSELIAEGSANLDVAEASRAKKTQPAVINLFLIFSRIGRLPDDFTKKLRAHLATIRDEAHLGVWSEWKKGDSPHDFTALAAWLTQEDPAYLRERIRAKAGGPTPWSARRAERVARPWLVFHPEMLARLALVTDVTQADCTPAGMELFEALDQATGEPTRRGCQPRKPTTVQNSGRARLVVASDFGSSWLTKPQRLDGDWPFTLDFGWVECIPVRPPGLDKSLEAVVFRTASASYAVNGIAISHKLGDDLASIWATNPQTPALKISVSGAIQFGLALCAQ